LAILSALSGLGRARSSSQVSTSKKHQRGRFDADLDPASGEDLLAIDQLEE